MSDSIGILLTDASRMIRRRFDTRAKGIGITNPQWRVLAILNRRPGINQGQIADILEVEPITTCRMVDRLEQAGLVERRRDPNDRRAWQVFTTPKAMPLVERMQRIADEIMAKTLMGLDDQAVTALTVMLEQVRVNLSDDSSFAFEEAGHG